MTHDGECEVLNLKDYDRCYCAARHAAPALLEALERIVNGDRRLTVPNVMAAEAAIALAKGAK